MPHFIIKLKRGRAVRYLEWSTVVDAPITFGMTLARFRQYYLEEYGRSMLVHLPERLARVEKNGISSMEGTTLEDLERTNRAGPRETRLTLDEIFEKYCVRMDDKWTPDRECRPWHEETI